MKRIIIFIVSLWTPIILTAQEKVILPNSILRLKEKDALYQKEAQQQFIRSCRGSFHYDEQYSRAILDTIEIMYIPRFKVDTRKFSDRDFTRLQNFISSVKPVREPVNRRHGSIAYTFYFSGDRYMGGSQDTYFLTSPGITGDSLAHTRHGKIFEKAAIDIRSMNPKSLFHIRGLGGVVWLVLQDDSILIYDLINKRFCQPQEYLNRYTPEKLKNILNLIFF